MDTITVTITDTLKIVDTVMIATNTASAGMDTNTIILFVTILGVGIAVLKFLFDLKKEVANQGKEIANLEIRMTNRITNVEIGLGDLKSEVKVLHNKFDGIIEDYEETNARVDKIEEEIREIIIVKEEVKEIKVVKEDVITVKENVKTVEKDVKEIKENVFNLIEKIVDKVKLPETVL
jgi:peptidoglycan hydrolase CwlO-like protein